jgi:crotonyl-CoA reductase
MADSTAFGTMAEIRDAILAGADSATIAKLPIPASYRAAHLLKSETSMFDGMASNDKDPRKSLHVGEVPTRCTSR